MLLNLKSDTPFLFISAKAIMLRGAIVFSMSSLMAYILIFKLRQVFRDIPLLASLLIKTGILLVASLFMNFLLHFTYTVFILGLTPAGGLHKFLQDATSDVWLIHHSIGWVVLFIVTQLGLEFYEKYSPGVFWNILVGRYIKPKAEKRIVMFIDLIDSTHIAENLTSLKYFSFIRDFIYYLSIALLEYHGRIYQYVGDEIVVSWKYNKKNKKNCINALMLSERMLTRNARYFSRRYGFVPQFKAGIHAGELTVGEIGFVKKDIAMSGDIMNTAAHIRTACTELNHRCLISKDFLDDSEIGWPLLDVGEVELKGKSERINLFAFKI
jgi:adenylate cyclase